MDGESNIIEEIHKRFRTSATALSVTLIGLSGASISAVRASSLLPHGVKTVLMLPFAIVIVLGLMMQYFHFNGYRLASRALVDELRSRDEAIAEIIKSRTESSAVSVGFTPLLEVLPDTRIYLIYLERATRCAFYIFLVAFGLTIIVFSWYGS